MLMRFHINGNEGQDGKKTFQNGNYEINKNILINCLLRIYGKL